MNLVTIAIVALIVAAYILGSLASTVETEKQLLHRY